MRTDAARVWRPRRRGPAGPRRPARRRAPSAASDSATFKLLARGRPRTPRPARHGFAVPSRRHHRERAAGRDPGWLHCPGVAWSRPTGDGEELFKLTAADGGAATSSAIPGHRRRHRRGRGPRRQQRDGAVYVFRASDGDSWPSYARRAGGYPSATCGDRRRHRRGRGRASTPKRGRPTSFRPTADTTPGCRRPAVLRRTSSANPWPSGATVVGPAKSETPDGLPSSTARARPTLPHADEGATYGQMVS